MIRHIYRSVKNPEDGTYYIENSQIFGNIDFHDVTPGEGINALTGKVQV